MKIFMSSNSFKIKEANFHDLRRIQNKKRDDFSWLPKGDAPFKAINALRRGTNVTSDGFLIPSDGGVRYRYREDHFSEG
jgi:hypothetical protein